MSKGTMTSGWSLCAATQMLWQRCAEIARAQWGGCRQAGRIAWLEELATRPRMPSGQSWRAGPQLAAFLCHPLQMEMHRAEQRATAERHARATAEHFKKTAREQAESVAKLAGALEASQRSVEGSVQVRQRRGSQPLQIGPLRSSAVFRTICMAGSALHPFSLSTRRGSSVQVLELDVSRLRGQLDAVSSDVTRTRGALFEAVEEAMGRHARSFGDAAPVADVVRLAAEVRGVCDTLEQHMAQVMPLSVSYSTDELVQRRFGVARSDLFRPRHACQGILPWGRLFAVEVVPVS